MDIPPSREALLQRIADLEDELLSLRKNQETIRSSKGFGLADFEHAADGICVCHAIDDFPFVRFTFWNQRMVDLCGYDLEEINRKGWYQIPHRSKVVLTCRVVGTLIRLIDDSHLHTGSEWNVFPVLVD